jgi:hypothetical protein
VERQHFKLTPYNNEYQRTYVMSSQFTDLYPHLSGLDEYSLAVAGWIHRIYPQWTSYMRVDTFKDYSYLGVHIPAPVSGPYPLSLDELLISTQPELTVYYSGFHAHFGQSDRLSKADFSQAKIFIDGFVQEKTVVLVGEKFWACCDAELIDQAIQNWISRGYSVEYTRSWHGTYNRVYKADANNTLTD